MQDWPDLLRHPTKLDADKYGEWFATIARRLLGPTRLRAGDELLRFTEIEFYYHGPEHPDVFAHRDPVQIHTGRWYFHRTRGEYRGGSFKGLDLAFGFGSAHAGILLRGVERPDGTLIDGPSLFVDHLLKKTGFPTVAALDADINSRLAWEKGNTLSLETLSEEATPEMLVTSRVGLSLKRQGVRADALRFILRRYRFLTEPLRIKKGKVQMVLALHADGVKPEEIRLRTGAPAKSVASHIAAFEEGRKETDFKPYAGKDLTTSDLARLHGLWHARFGPK